MSEKRKRILFQISFVFFSMLIIEVVLRAIGYKPGDMKPKWLNFHQVDSLYVINNFYTDPDGILLADSLDWAKNGIHINEGGFRSPNFSKLDSTKKKILFIGDSFTWGMSAEPLAGNCFVDLIRNETNYEVINLGIPVADPVQYEMLAQKYISALKPDYVFVIFFMGNDLMKEDRKVIPGSPFYYYSNAGALLADMDGHHFKSAQEAYNYFLNEKYYLHQPKNILEKIVAKSSLLSRLYSVRYQIQEKLEYEHVVKDTRITKKYLWQIKEIARENQVPLKFVLIPEIKEAEWPLTKYTEKYKDILADTILKKDWLLTKNSKVNYNDYPDGHLNNLGHRLYANLIESFLDSGSVSKTLPLRR